MGHTRWLFLHWQNNQPIIVTWRQFYHPLLLHLRHAIGTQWEPKETKRDTASPFICWYHSWTVLLHKNEWFTQYFSSYFEIFVLPFLYLIIFSTNLFWIGALPPQRKRPWCVLFWQTYVVNTLLHPAHNLHPLESGQSSYRHLEMFLQPWRTERGERVSNTISRFFLHACVGAHTNTHTHYRSPFYV